MEVTPTSFFEVVSTQFENSLPFVIYNKPNSNEISGLLQSSDVLFTAETYTESGFVFAPFDADEVAVMIPFSESKKVSCSVGFSADDVQEIENIEATSAEKNHISLVEKTINEINTSAIKKIVISRTKEVQVATFDFISVFKKLVKTYPTAFCYAWYHPKVGFWMGATPETLLTLNGNAFQTMALAGTQPYKNTIDVLWGAKEQEEQRLVTESIVNNLKPITTNLQVSEVETIKAGTLLHLRTVINGTLGDTTVKDFIYRLHPTPAVCGLPMQDAKAFILKNEGYPRRFYTGFLGELNADKTHTELYVNLRCMEYVEEKLLLYVGGGITKDSDAKSEWEETENKTQTMLNVLAK
ncbi:isochorismate synthase [Joostella sp. CR20]|uniref:isochorismate synthase n=1 Tax=Joostella sp. CR20 TaxID=2804312 RepID=UPI00313C9436